MTKTLTFDAKVIAYGPNPQNNNYPCYPTDFGWSVTIDGHDDTSGERSNMRLILEGHSACPIISTNQDARIRVTVEILEPKTRVVPWKAEEVPLGCLVRGREAGDTTRSILTSVSGDTAWSGSFHWTLDSLSVRYDHSTDGGKTWKPAGKVEEVYK